MVIKAKFEKSNLDEVVSKLKQCASGTSALKIKTVTTGELTHIV